MCPVKFNLGGLNPQFLEIRARLHYLLKDLDMIRTKAEKAAERAVERTAERAAEKRGKHARSRERKRKQRGGDSEGGSD